MYSPQVLITAIFQILLTSFSTLLLSSVTLAKEPISAMDIFNIAYASNPIISADGETIAFHRYSMDVMTDQRKNDLWVIDADGKNIRQISKGFDAVVRRHLPSLETPSLLLLIRAIHPISTYSSWPLLRDQS